MAMLATYMFLLWLSSAAITMLQWGPRPYDCKAPRLHSVPVWKVYLI